MSTSTQHGTARRRPAKRLSKLRRIDRDNADTAAPPAKLTETDRLSDAVANLRQKLDRTRRALRQTQAELALQRKPMPTTGGGNALLQKLRRVLKRGCIAAQCEHVGFYVLDEKAQQLRLRVSAGLPTSSLMNSPRQLEGSVADLQALITGSCFIEDQASAPDWRAPENYGSAMCVRVDGADTAIGTLWMWRDTPGDFGREARAAIKAAAQLIAAELDRELSARTAARFQSLHDDLLFSAQMQEETELVEQQIAAGWDFAGRTVAGKMLPAGTVCCDINQRGQIEASLLECRQPHVQSAITAAAVHAAIESHARYSSRMEDVLSRSHDYLFNRYSGGQHCDVFLARVDPDNGDAEIAGCGGCTALVVNRYGCRQIAERTMPLGSHPDLGARTMETRLLDGDWLICCSPNLIRADTQRSGGMITQSAMWDTVRRSQTQTAAELVGTIEEMVSRQGGPRGDWSIFALHRQA